MDSIVGVILHDVVCDGVYIFIFHARAWVTWFAMNMYIDREPGYVSPEGGLGYYNIYNNVVLSKALFVMRDF